MKQRCSAVFLFAVFIYSIVLAQPSTRILSPQTEAKIDSIINIMTREEKLGQLNQIGGTWYDTKSERLNEEQTAMLKRGEIGSFLGIAGAVETGRIQRIAVEQTRLKIPVLFGFDIIHGYRTITPIPLAEASSWNTDLVERSAHVAAVEGAAAGIHWTYAPMVDIARDPRWGRIAEGSGEDPFLGSAMAVARVKGFQGKNLMDDGSLLACVKHFAVYGGAEAGRDYNTVDLSERTLREIYLPPYKAAIDAGAWTVMSAFNEIGGVPSSGSSWLMTDVLRNEWNFKGLVLSDYTAILELMNHRIAKDSTDAGIIGLSSGVDIDMVSRIYLRKLGDAIRSKRLSDKILNEAVRRVLRVKYVYGLFDHPFRNASPEKERELLLTKEHREVARAMAQQSIVLLKNDKNILPLNRSIKTIALIGPFAGNENRRDLAGAWAWVQKPEEIVSVIDGIRSKLPSTATVLYDKGCEIISDSGMRIDQAVKLAKKADVVIAVLGESQRLSGEAASRTNIDLPGRQKELLQALQKAGTPVVLVVMNGRPLTLQWESENIPAIVESWHLGVETGNALADVLFGDYNPSGKLPVSFPRNLGQIPVYYNHKSTGRPLHETDKFTSRYLDAPNTPLFPFGFGLSYTTFSYNNITTSSLTTKKDQNIIVSVDVENSGKRTGEEVVQLYLRDDVATVTRPVKELKGFQKIILQPGEKKTVSFTISPDDMSFYDLSMQKVVEPGTFTVCIGGNSVDCLETSFEVIQYTRMKRKRGRSRCIDDDTPELSPANRMTMKRPFYIALLFLFFQAIHCNRALDEITVIKFWGMGNEGEMVQSLIKEFERRNPAIKVEVQQIPWTAAHEKLLTAYAGESTPDVCQLGNTWLPEFTVLNALEPLQPFVDHSALVDLNDIFPGVLKTNILDSILYGVPWYVDTRVIFYRKDILKQAGYSEFPKTWNEVLKASETIQRQAKARNKVCYPFFLPTNEWVPAIVLGMQSGGNFLKSKNSQSNFSGAQFTKAFSLMSEFYQKEYSPSGMQSITNLYNSFSDGLIAMYITGPWNIGEFTRRIPPELQNEWMTAPLPSMDSISPGVSLPLGTSLVIFKDSKHKEASWKLIEFLTSVEQSIQFYRITGNLPPRRSAWNDSSLSSNRYIKAFYQQLQRVDPLPQIPEWEQIVIRLQIYIEYIATRTMTVEQSLRQFDGEVDVILEKRRWIVEKAK